MTRFRSTAVGAIALLGAIGLMAACTPPEYGGPPTTNWKFETNTVRVNHSQDKVCVLVCVNTHDEPYSLNIAFRVKVGEPNSAQTSVVEGDSHNDVGEGETYTMQGGERARTNFPAVGMVDLLDLALGAKLEVVGVWTWAMEEDFIGVNSAAHTVADAVQSALNSTLATASLPSDASQIVSTVLSSVGIGGAFTILGTTLLRITGLQDDAVGSRMYIGLGVTGGLGDVIDSTVGTVAFPTLAIPAITIPPDIEGGQIFRLGSTASQAITNQLMNQPSVDGDYTMSFGFSTS
jgi:hypothetical protein